MSSAVANSQTIANGPTRKRSPANDETSSMPKPPNEHDARGAERQIAPQQRAEGTEAQRDGDQEHDLAEQLGGGDRPRGGLFAV